MFILLVDKIGKMRKKRRPKKKKSKEKKRPNLVRLGYQSIATARVTRNLTTLGALGQFSVALL